MSRGITSPASRASEGVVTIAAVTSAIRAIRSLIGRAPSSREAQSYRKASTQSFWNYQRPPRRRDGPPAMTDPLAWLPVFAFTQLVELPVYRRAGCSWWGAFAASAITHPVLWFALFPLVRAGYAEKVLAAEVFAVLVEALWRRVALKRPRALAWSLAANGFSFGLGTLSRYRFGWP